MKTWSHPSPHLTRLDAFRRHVNLKHHLALVDYEQLHEWSVHETESFYRDIWDFCGVVYSEPPTQVISNASTMWPRPEWFAGARLNWTENTLAVGLAAHPDRIAVSACREGGTQWSHLTWKQLEREVARYASALRHANVQAGDRLAAVMTNSLEALLVLLACGSIGAIFSSASPEMGANGIIERYMQSQPRILFLESHVLYGGKSRDMRKKPATVVKELRARVSGLEKVVISGPTWEDSALVPLNEFLSVPVEPLQFAQVPFDHPVYILYSSGTTGKPKCICHSGGGALLKQKIDMGLGMDLGLDSTYYQYTTTGWMMWNVIVGALSVGSKIILYDGSPLHPNPSFQLRFLEEQGVTHWGTGPKFLGTLMRDLNGPLPRLAALQNVLVAGSALSTEISDWFFTVFPSKVGLNNGSGGTDILGAIIAGNNLVKIHGNEIATASLGMKVEIWDENGRNVENSGEKGELVITKPFPSMPVTFWGDGGVEKYRKAYFDTFPGVWCHGDFVSKNNETGGYLVHGRSDGVLNPGGVRFGTAELYEVVSRFTEVDDCIAVGQRRPQDRDEQVLLFIKMRDGAPFSESLQSKIRDSIKTMLSPRHVPTYIHQVKDIPYTMSGKKIENAVRSVVSEERLKNSSAIVNPECLQEYEKYTSLPGVKLAPKL
ncbi:acetoacetate-CoA ligase [Fusarium oxysporum f. sp. conglutinans race 2 54008]|uniref:Acetoacetate-CoA ligase n=1 Tax=Fusarium oxysporum f. sp. conglutinans race 2 54008 TaxID=1089457 RepID=X0GX39_FUSOX|nr:acetoacetate-CoA ligase [Fusarium oxysporum f. sp. conglutinans race 2 54008]KAG6979475.1 Acetoacetyl-CoA synthetase [Fusarium oxysporum f. sp. conglutinans]KAI8402701.1 hypothetical protein FOFC_18017 [Fusarium oxysporum]